jgi:kumamolisin
VTTAKHHYHVKHRALRGVRLGRRIAARNALPAGTAPPSIFVAAYGFAAGACKGGASIKIGIVSLGGSYVSSDLEAACSAWSVPMPSVSVLAAGGATEDDNQDADVENALDLQCAAAAWSHITGTPAELVIAFGPNAEGGMLASLQALASVGCGVVSISWGGPASSWSAEERAGLAAEFAKLTAAGVSIFAASGDNSADDGTGAPCADYPCSDPNVWAVGGTSVELDASGKLASERAWGDGAPGDEGGGGGFDGSVAQPAWQAGVIPSCEGGRGVPDTSANADPQTGYQIIANGSATVVGGTSASTPLTAGIVAAVKSIAIVPGLLLPRLYAARATACNDITEGSDGFEADVGWDAATGLGSPKGEGFMTALAKC